MIPTTPMRLKLTKEDRDWAKAIKDRDGQKCVICGSNERLNSHHIIPRELHDTKYDIENGITLCVKHHMFSREISAHNNPLAFFVWMATWRGAQLEYLKSKC